MTPNLPSLLLLPPTYSPVTASSLSAAYHSPIAATITSLGRLPTSSQLIVVLPCRSFHDRLSLPRAQIYEESQKLLGGLYTLLCTVCAKLGVDVESDTPGSIDARILLLDYSAPVAGPDGPGTLHNVVKAGPVLDLQTLALTRRQWKTIFATDSDEGQNILAEYTHLANQGSPPLKAHVEIVSGGVTLNESVAIPARAAQSSSGPHNVVAVGGTFDHIHAGHKLLLTATALLLQPDDGVAPGERRLIIGITGDELLKNKKYAEYMFSWEKRQEDVVEFLLSILSFTRASPREATEILSFNKPIPNGHAIHTKIKGSSITIECVEIQDPFGPTITDESVTALVVSGETRSGGQAVNSKRLEKGWQALEVFEVDVLDAEEHSKGPNKTEEFASKISSTAIRKRMAERTSSL